MGMYLGQYLLRELIALVLIVAVMMVAVRFGLRSHKRSERIWAIVVTFWPGCYL